MYAKPDHRSRHRTDTSRNPLFSIRPTRTTDVAGLPALEMAAGALFRAISDLAWLADEEPTSAEAHHEHVRAGLSWVAVLDESPRRAVGFLIAKRHDAALHLTELSVHPDAQRRGIGAALLRRGLEEAARLEYSAATLTTFVDVPWNGPFYERHGFERIPEVALSEDLRRVLDSERRTGLPMDRRVAMRRPLL